MPESQTTALIVVLVGFFICRFKYPFRTFLAIESEGFGMRNLKADVSQSPAIQSDKVISMDA